MRRKKRTPASSTADIKRMQGQKEPRVLVVLKPQQVISWGQ